MSVDLPGSGVELVKRMQVGGDMENSWIMFDHVVTKSTSPFNFVLVRVK
jgi:hypothetical protein